MVLELKYFIILQLFVLLVFYLKRKESTNGTFLKIFSSRFHFLAINLSVFIACHIYNRQAQLFCITVPWAATIIILFCISFLVFPFVWQFKYGLPVIMVCGMGFFIGIYIILFGRGEFFYFTIFNVVLLVPLHLGLRFMKRTFNTNVFDSFYFYSFCYVLSCYVVWLHTFCFMNQ